VNEVLCHGCGVCAAACPSGAARVKNFAFEQIYQEVEALLK
jgi:heterodisulfide reductase subunit A